MRKDLFDGYKSGLKGKSEFEVHLLKDGKGNINRLISIINDYPEQIKELEENIVKVNTQIKEAEIEMEKPFIYNKVLLDSSIIALFTNVLLVMTFKNSYTLFLEFIPTSPL
ncbi:hypothetical protein WAK64_07555 [Bacillus spongiae]|uniref:Uncharacterized protein n=1 Tax=Bacillus spongiae TaxID=2683610 RepID=A0ABU8HCJ8_9BACI